MAMKPFCGYNFGDYWGHWLSLGQKFSALPEIFHVNWFRQDSKGKFIWPGFGENLRVLRWIIDRCEGRAEAKETPIGYLPAPEDLDVSGLDIDGATLEALLHVEKRQWRIEMDEIRGFLLDYGDRLPNALLEEERRIKDALR